MTPQGVAVGGVQREDTRSGIPYVAWPGSIATNNALRNTMNDVQGNRLSTDGEGSTVKKVFVSSTVWDLADVRSELYEFLLRNGFEPLMSDKDGFIDDLKPDGSYEKCRKGVVACDIFLMIVNSRYGGPRQPKPDEVSITHQEFRWAVAEKKPFICFVRDKVEAEMKTWKDNGKNPAVKLSFVKEEKDHRIFEMIEEMNHAAPDGRALWWRTFVDSVDLKRQLMTKLGITDLSNDYLAQAQRLQALPRIVLHITHGSMEHDGRVKNGVALSNVGSGAATDVEIVMWEADQQLCTRTVKGVLAASAVSIDLVYPLPGVFDTRRVARVVMRYKNILGGGFETEYTLDYSNNRTVPVYKESFFGALR